MPRRLARAQVIKGGIALPAVPRPAIQRKVSAPIEPVSSLQGSSIVEEEADVAEKEPEAARDRFNYVKRRRTEQFKKAFEHIAERIDQVYKDLTKNKAAPMGGVAYLTFEDDEEPYLRGINYRAMPPIKRFPIYVDQLSGLEEKAGRGTGSSFRYPREREKL